MSGYSLQDDSQSPNRYRQDRTLANQKWLKGNIHTHTTESDGDASPQHVAEWYKQHGYDFLVISDHNHLTVLDEAANHPGDWPLLIPGEEVTSRLFGNTVPVHVNAIGIDSVIEPAEEESAQATLQENVNRIRRAGGLPSINHPNYKWTLSAENIVETTGAWAVEVYNGHPGSNTNGGGGCPSVESMWDAALTAGRRIYGVATDDSHHYQVSSPQLANPGRGWVVVRAEKSAGPELLTAMSEGQFYSSSGVVIQELKNCADEIVIEMEPYDSERFTTVFYGEAGVKLAEEHGPSVRFKPPASQPYVRATVYSSRESYRAWTQPVFPG